MTTQLVKFQNVRETCAYCLVLQWARSQGCPAGSIDNIQLVIQLVRERDVNKSYTTQQYQQQQHQMLTRSNVIKRGKVLCVYVREGI